MNPKLAAIFTIIRPRFFPLSVIAVILGASVAFWMTSEINLSTLLLSVVGIICIHAGINSANEYFDFLSGADLVYSPTTKYSGGTRVLPSQRLHPFTVFNISLLAFLSGSLIGLYLTEIVGTGLLVIGLIGVVLGYFYTAPPLKLVYRGLGELYVALNYGLLIVPGAFYVQTGFFAVQVLVAAVPVALSNAAGIVIHKFPDTESDRKAGKNNIVVIIGKYRSARLYLILVAGTYISILAGVLLQMIPWISLIVLLSLPFYIRNSLRVIADPGNLPMVERASSDSVNLIFFSSVAMIASYLMTTIFPNLGSVL